MAVRRVDSVERRVNKFGLDLVPISDNAAARGVFVAAAAELFGDLCDIYIALGTQADTVFFRPDFACVNDGFDLFCGERDIYKSVVVAVNGTCLFRISSVCRMDATCPDASRLTVPSTCRINSIRDHG